MSKRVGAPPDSVRLTPASFEAFIVIGYTFGFSARKGGAEESAEVMFHKGNIL